ncbi:MAG: MCE family protein [Prolixibacteraceae bacterium]|nr:MCE family protein [Prolixibacteraceae bacterium]
MKRAVIVGIFVMLGTSFLIAGILLVGNLRETFTTKIELIAHFDDVGGLKRGDNIWFSGVKIGTVSGQQFYGKSQVEIHIAIDVKAQKYIFKDANVKLSSDGFIGNKILVIYGGTETAGIIEPGDTLTVGKTLGTEEIMATLQQNNQNIMAITDDLKILTSKIVSGEGSIGKIMNDNNLYDDLLSIMSSLKTTAKKANNMMGDLADITEGLQAEGSLIGELTRDTLLFQSFSTTMLQLEQIAGTADGLLRGIQTASADTTVSLGILMNDQETGASLKETIKNLESSSEKLDEDLKALQSNFLFRRYFKQKAKTDSSTDSGTDSN